MKKLMGSRWFYLLLFSFIVLILAGLFWLGPGSDAIGFSIVTIYFAVPAAIFVLSFFHARRTGDYRVLYAALLYGLGFMLLEYLTFGLANMITFSKVNPPAFELFRIGTIISVVAMVISKLTIKKDIE